MPIARDRTIHAGLGEGLVDREGAAIAVARMEVEKSYKDTGLLLQRVIRDNDERAWLEIKAKIHYTYENLDAALSAPEVEEGFLSRIRERLLQGQKLLRKSNLVKPEGIHGYNHGHFIGTTSNTDRPFVAAVMRWFHDRGDVSYYQMSLGEVARSSPTGLGSRRRMAHETVSQMLF